MKLILRYRNHEPSPSFTDLLNRELDRLGKRRRIDEARLLIECRPEASPAFHVSAQLVTPGPDVFAEAADHTLRAALQKVIGDLESEIDERELKRARRGSGQLKTKSPAHLTAVGGRS